jgi:SAM-dependent methyltransferase
MDEFTQAQRATWEAGDYGVLSPYISHVGERVVSAAGVEPGMRVLDVACGTGNAALPAARAGARVTGLDLVPKLLEQGRTKAAEEGLDVEWVEGDAEELPFDTAAFDRVFSTFGHMFAPRHERTAAEMRRVCREGGAIGICTWRADGTVGATFAAAGPYQPPPPDFAQPPILWGSEDYVKRMFPDASGYEFEEHSATIEWESPEGFLEFFCEHFPPMVMARQMLGERFADMRRDVLAVWTERNRADNGRLDLPQEYLQSVVRL